MTGGGIVCILHSLSALCSLGHVVAIEKVSIIQHIFGSMHTMQLSRILNSNLLHFGYVNDLV
ncbi:hypothetical protein MTR_5g008940 [Medicago truncatula]|uniref:Transmembrane protein n=1 Tax=Medicago truncatula TaxID=3880 RepID=G7K993_MEDTR|nr:hypothetical protein MTR_5g008940 [Medicago truncatula]